MSFDSDLVKYCFCKKFPNFIISNIHPWFIENFLSSFIKTLEFTSSNTAFLTDWKLIEMLYCLFIVLRSSINERGYFVVNMVKTMSFTVLGFCSNKGSVNETGMHFLIFLCI